MSSSNIPNGNRDQFIQGLAYSIAWIIKAHDEVSLAMELLASSGHTYADLQKAGCDSHDLKPIAKELGLRLDGKPLKKQRESEVQ